MSHSEDFLKVVGRIDLTVKAVLASNLKWYEKVGKIVEAIVPEVEVIGDTWKGAEKKQFAMELVEDIYFRYFNSKYIPDFLERILVKSISSKAIDAFVSLMNKKGVFSKH